MSNITLEEKKSIQISVIFFFASKSGHSQDSNFVFNLLTLSMFDLRFLYNYRPNFFEQNLNWRFYYFSGGFDLKTIEIDPRIKTLIVQSFQKVLIKNGSSRLSKWRVSVKTVLIPFMRVAISKFTFREKKSIQVLAFWFFCNKIRTLPGIDFFINLCWFFFSFCIVTINLISSSKASTKNLILYQKDSFK